VTRILVLGRVRKGRPIEAAVTETVTRLEVAGAKVDHAVVKHKKELRKRSARAVKDGLDVVVAVGGDGAVLQVVNGIAESDVALGIVPMGTGNLLAGNLDIPGQIERAVEVILDGRERRIDLGRVTVDGKKRDFSVACGIGFDAQVMDATDQAQKRRWGKLAYVANAIREGRKIQEVVHTVTIDGEAIETPAAQVFVANFGKIGAVLEPRRRIIPDDGLLDVIVVRASGPIEGMLAGWDALRQRRLGEHDGGRVFRRRGREIKVSSRPRQLVEIDGSVVGRTPIEAVLRPGALRVLVPRDR
jgi:diacylglycerol kinase (ATP)